MVFVWLVFAAISLAKGNLAFIALSGTLNYLDVAAQVGIIGTAVALLMIAGEFDLSVGSLVGFAGIIVIGIGVTIWGLPLWLSIIMSMVATTLLGVLNGLIVVRTGLPSFIVTLATLFIISGFSSVLTSLVTNITYIPIDRAVVAADPIAGLFNWSLPVGGGAALKVSIIWWIIIAVLGVYLLGRTRFGNWIAGAGGSATAARNLGVPVARVKVSLFALTAFSASILATIQSMTFFSADILRGRGIELDAITTAVIGGSLLTGGYGSVALNGARRPVAGHGPPGHRLRRHQRRLVQDRDRHAAAGGRGPQQLDPAPVRRAVGGDGPMELMEAVPVAERATAVPAAGQPALLEARDVSKYFGAVVAIEGVSLTVRAGQITCLLGDNGAGKSTLIKTLSGVHVPDKGTLAVDGEPVVFSLAPRRPGRGGRDRLPGPRDHAAHERDPGLFFLGNEPTVGVGPLKRFDMNKAAGIAHEEMKRIGIDIRDQEAGGPQRAGQLRVGGEGVDGAVHVELGVGARVAAVGHRQVEQLLPVRLKHLGQRLQQPPALGEGHGPQGGAALLAGVVEGGLEVEAGRVHPGQRLLGRRA